MKNIELDISDIDKLPKACKELLEFAGNIKTFLFTAEMGVGKTTFIKHLSTVLGSKDNLSSPTYSIVNEYVYPKGKIFHFDLYRINSKAELFDLGFEEYLSSENYCFIEWPQHAIDFIDRPYLRIIINQNQNNRYLSAQIIE